MLLWDGNLSLQRMHILSGRRGVIWSSDMTTKLAREKMKRSRSVEMSQNIIIAPSKVVFIAIY